MSLRIDEHKTNFGISLAATTAFGGAFLHNTQSLASFVLSACEPVFNTGAESSISAKLTCGTAVATSVLFKVSLASLVLVTVYEGLVVWGYEKQVNKFVKDLSSQGLFIRNTLQNSTTPQGKSKFSFPSLTSLINFPNNSST